MARQTSTARSAALAGSCLVALAAAPGLRAQNASAGAGGRSLFQAGAGALQNILKLQHNTNRAKNVILIVGDGMGFSTVTATRIFEGQQRGVDGESNVLAWEAFPHLAASKTYSADAQITDSAPSAVAMTAGVKTINDRDGDRSHLDARKLRRPEDQGGNHAVGTGGDGRHVDGGHHHRAADPRNAGGRLFAHRQPRLGIRRGNAARGAGGGVRRHRAAAGRDALRRRHRGRHGRRPQQLPAGGGGRPGGRGRDRQAEGRQGPDPGLARPLQQLAAPLSGTRSSSTRSMRPRPTTCSGSSRGRTWSTTTTGRRIPPASRR